MMQLTQEQHLTLEKDGQEPVRAVDPATLIEYVLVRADVYDRFKMTKTICVFACGLKGRMCQWNQGQLS